MKKTLRTIRQMNFSSCRSRTLPVWGVALLSCALAGCTVGPKYHVASTQAAPALYKETPARNQGTGIWTVAKPQDAMLRGNWWEIFHEPELNALEEQLNINNQTIKQYFENYMEARALIGEARAQYFPSASASPSFNRARSSGNLTNSSQANPGKLSTLYSLPLSISWEPDLWGRVRNQVHATEYNAQVSAADLANERLSEQVTLAEYFFEIRGQDALAHLYAQTVEADKQALALAQTLYETGVDQKISVVEAESTLHSAESAATNLGILRAQYENGIAVLVGKQASNFSIPVRPLTTAPPPIPIGVPSQLLERRPDVAAAERTMATENAEIGVADSAFYPNLILSAGGGTQTSAFSHLLDWPSRFWSVGGSLSQPLFNAALNPTIHQYVAIYNADVANYRQTVLVAFGQVENYLAEVRILSKQIQQQRQAVDSAQTALNLEMNRYKSGLDPYIDVVNLQTTLLDNQRTLTNLQVEQMTGAVQLVGSLGGGWDRSQLPTPAQASRRPAKAETVMQR